MKKERLMEGFVLVFALALAVTVIYMNAGFNLTGNSVGVVGDYITQETCEAANYTWNETIEENCTTIEECTVCTEGCVTSYTETLCGEGCVTEYTEVLCEEGCSETCEECENVSVYTCIGELCGNSNIDSDEECDNGDQNGVECTTSYDTDCDYCSSSCTLVTIEAATCGDSTCDSEEDCSSCETDCGECEDDDDDSSSDSSSESSSSTTVVTTNTISSCTPSWECDEWGECTDGTQIRACIDVNQCDSEENMPEISQSCEMPILETCFDGIQNQDEQGVDCGGSCEESCSIFSIVGSVISAPLDIGKNFVLEGVLGSIPRMILSTGILVLVIGGVVVTFFFKKKKKDLKKLDTAIDNLSKKK